MLNSTCGIVAATPETPRPINAIVAGDTAGIRSTPNRSLEESRRVTEQEPCGGNRKHASPVVEAISLISTSVVVHAQI